MVYGDGVFGYVDGTDLLRGVSLASLNLVWGVSPASIHIQPEIDTIKKQICSSENCN